MANLHDLLNFANDDKPVDFADSFNQLIGQKVLDALNATKQNVASRMFSDTNDEVTRNGDSNENA